MKPDLIGARNCRIDLIGVKQSLKGAKCSLNGLPGVFGIDR